MWSFWPYSMKTKCRMAVSSLFSWVNVLINTFKHVIGDKTLILFFNFLFIQFKHLHNSYKDSIPTYLYFFVEQFAQDR